MLVVLPDPLTPITRMTVNGDLVAKRRPEGLPSSLVSSSRSASCAWEVLRICSSMARLRKRSISHAVVPGPTSALSNASSSSSQNSSVMGVCLTKDSLIRPNILRVRLKLLLNGFESGSDMKSPPTRSCVTVDSLFGSSCGFCPKNRLSTPVMTPYVFSLFKERRQKEKGFTSCLHSDPRATRQPYWRLPRYWWSDPSLMGSLMMISPLRILMLYRQDGFVHTHALYSIEAPW